MSNEVQVKLTLDDQMKGPLDKSEQAVKSFGDKVTGTLKAVAGAWAIKEVGGFMAGLARDAAEGEALVNRLGNVLKATGEACGWTTEQLVDFADELKATTTYEDEAIVGAMTLMSTFRNIRGDVFKDATRAAADMATVMGTDITAATMQLSKALNDPLQGMNALRRSGVSFSEQQKQQIEGFLRVNDVASAQRVILAELRNEFGGAAAGEVNTSLGRFKQLEIQLGDVGKAIGAALLPYIDMLVNKLSELIGTAEDTVKSTSGVAKAFAFLADWLANVGLIINAIWAMLQQGMADVMAMVYGVGAALEWLGVISADTAKNLKDMWEASDKAAKATGAEVKRQFLGLDPSQRLKNQAEEQKKNDQARRGNQPFEVKKPEEDDAVKEERKRVDAEAKKAEAVVNANMTPGERMQKTIADLEKLRQESLKNPDKVKFSADDLARGKAKAREDFDKSDKWTQDAKEIKDALVTPAEKYKDALGKIDDLTKLGSLTADEARLAKQNAANDFMANDTKESFKASIEDGQSLYKRIQTSAASAADDPQKKMAVDIAKANELAQKQLDEAKEQTKLLAKNPAANAPARWK